MLFGPSNFDKNKGVFEHNEDAQSVSTVSGSGMDFFRKFVQRKGPKSQPSPPQHDDQAGLCTFSDLPLQLKVVSASSKVLKNQIQWCALMNQQSQFYVVNRDKLIQD